MACKRPPDGAKRGSGGKKIRLVQTHFANCWFGLPGRAPAPKTHDPNRPIPVNAVLRFRGGPNSQFDGRGWVGAVTACVGSIVGGAPHGEEVLLFPGVVRKQKLCFRKKKILVRCDGPRRGGLPNGEHAHQGGSAGMEISGSFPRPGREPLLDAVGGIVFRGCSR